jgi:hypothetical protein
LARLSSFLIAHFKHIASPLTATQVILERLGELDRIET